MQIEHFKLLFSITIISHYTPQITSTTMEYIIQQEYCYYYYLSDLSKRQGDTKRQSLYKDVSLEDTKLKTEGINTEKNTATKPRKNAIMTLGLIFQNPVTYL